MDDYIYVRELDPVEPEAADHAARQKFFASFEATLGGMLTPAIFIALAALAHDYLYTSFATGMAMALLPTAAWIVFVALVVRDLWPRE